MTKWINRKPLKILMTTDTVGDVWSYSVELCKALQPYNVHFFLVTMGAPMQLAQKMDIENLENVTIYETDFLLESMESPWQSIDASKVWLLKMADKIQPDLIHLNSFVYGALRFKAPVIMVTQSDVFSRWKAVKGQYPPAEWNEYFKRVQEGLDQADFIVAPSKAAMNDVRKIYSTRTPGRVIYNGRSSVTFHPAQKQPFICSVGSILDEAKNVRLLVDAAKKIPCEIRLVGDARFDDETCMTTDINLTHLGNLHSKEIARELAAASIYVAPAKYEPFGLSVLEAALSGCALVLGKINSLKEIWGDSAMYVDTNDPGKLANTINFLIENGEARVHYARKALNRAKNFTTSAMAFNYMQVYTTLLQSKKQFATSQNI